MEFDAIVLDFRIIINKVILAISSINKTSGRYFNPIGLHKKVLLTCKRFFSSLRFAQNDSGNMRNLYLGLKSVSYDNTKVIY